MLDLQCCDLGSLPPQLGLMTSLRSLLLEGNGLRTIRRPLITGAWGERKSPMTRWARACPQGALERRAAH